jgi:hypothetical protein
VKTTTMSKILLTVLVLVPVGFSLWWLWLGSPALRIFGAVVLLGGIALLAWLWWPRGSRNALQ